MGVHAPPTGAPSCCLMLAVSLHTVVVGAQHHAVGNVRGAFEDILHSLVALVVAGADELLQSVADEVLRQLRTP